MTISDEGGRTCPLCAEEMDLTDQQLKPCKCGYEICVWCWHHIIEMAEKEDTEGRCPACRTPYDKIRIVGAAAKCEKIISGSYGERRQKTQRTKPMLAAKTRLHLSNARVIQRNLVYIIGLPLILADESVLECKEYFGQYGSVLKVSISCPTNATLQNSSNSTFSVYITYTKEEEAARCIQAVHNFVLEGKSLKAYYGTTKYCHAWLRNMTCMNPDCLYLHDIGIQEDRFTKDEIISSYTRVSNKLQRRSGNTLPAPLYDLSNSGPSPAKTTVKYSSNASATPVKTSISNCSSTSRSSGLPAAALWGSQGSQPTIAPTKCLQNALQRDRESQPHPSNLSSTVLTTNLTYAWQDNEDGNFSARDHVATSKSQCENENSPRQNSAWSDNDMEAIKLPEQNSNSRSWYLETSKSNVDRDFYAVVSNSLSKITCAEHISSAWDDDDDTVSTPTQVSQGSESVDSSDKSLEFSRPDADIKGINVLDLSEKSVGGASCASKSHAIVNIGGGSSDGSLCHDALENEDKNAVVQDHTKISDICCSEIGILENGISETPTQSIASYSGSVVHSIPSDISFLNVNNSATVCSKPLCHGVSGFPRSKTSHADDKAIDTQSIPLKNPYFEHRNSYSPTDSSNNNSELLKQMLLSSRNGTTDSLEVTFDHGHINSVDVSQMRSINSHKSDNTSSSLWISGNESNDFTMKDQAVVTHGKSSLSSRADYNLLSNGNHLRNMGRLLKDETDCEYYNMIARREEKNARELNNISKVNNVASMGLREKNAVSKILDFNLWDDSLTAANEFVKVLRETNRQNAAAPLSGSSDGRLSSQSRFSFAREDNEPVSDRLFPREHGTSYVQTSMYSTEDAFGIHLSDNVAMRNPGPTPIFTNAQMFGFSSKTSDSLQSVKVSAPPGFSVRSRAPPPGFATEEIREQNHDAFFPENRSMTSTSVHLSDSSCDVEFIDPAILAVGKGYLPRSLNEDRALGPSFPPSCFSDIDPRVQLLMQQPVSTSPFMGFGHMRDGSSPVHDTFVPHFVSQNYYSLSPLRNTIKSSSNSQISHSPWSNCNDANFKNDFDIAEKFGTERLGPTKYFPGREEPKFHVYSSDNFYHRAFGI